MIDLLGKTRVFSKTENGISRQMRIHIIGLTIIELILAILLWASFLQTTSAYSLSGDLKSNLQADNPADFGFQNDTLQAINGSSTAIPALQSSTSLTVSIIGSPWAPLDNNQPTNGSRVFVVESVITNTGNTTATDVVITLDYNNDNDWIPVPGEDLERTINSLGPGETYHALWFASYPSTKDVTHVYTVTAEATNASPVATSENFYENPDGDTVKTVGVISAENTGAISTTVDVRVGVAFTVTITYDLGSNPETLILSPAGNLDFLLGAYRMLGSEVRLYNDAQTQEKIVTNQLYFPSLILGDGNPADKADVTYTFIVGTGDSTTLCPYAIIGTSTNYKIDRDYCDADTVIVIPSLTLSLTKQVSSLTIQQNQLLTYTISYTNTGDQPLQDIWVWDDLPSGASIIASSINPASDPDETTDSRVAWDIGTLPKAGDPGSSGTLTFSVLVDGDGQDLADNTLLVNNAFIGIKQGGLPQLSALTSTVTTTLQAPMLTISKTDGQDTANPGDPLTYVIQITNTGSVPATGLVVTDVLPANVLIGAPTPTPSSQNGQTLVWNNLETLEITIPVQVDPNLSQDGTVLTNTVEVSYQNSAGHTFAAETATDTTTVDVPTSQLSLSKTAEDLNGEPLVVGDTIRYTLQVTNTGTFTAYNVTVTDDLPIEVTCQSVSGGPTCDDDPLMWDVGDLSPQDTATMFIEVMINPGTEGLSIVNSASVTATNVVDPVPDPKTCPDGTAPVDGTCDNTPEPNPNPAPSTPNIFLPIILRSQ